MGAQAVLYKRRKLAAATQAEDELEFYYVPAKLTWPRPCWCEWAHTKDKLLGRPERQGIPCACAGPVGFNVPGYTGHWGQGDEHRMREFARRQEAIWRT